MCELPGFSAISGLPGVAGQGLRSLEVMQSVSSINTETHTDTQTHTHTSSGKQGFRAVWSAALQKTLQGFLRGQPLWTSLPHLSLFFLLHLPSSWMHDFFLTAKDTSLSFFLTLKRERNKRDGRSSKSQVAFIHSVISGMTQNQTWLRKRGTQYPTLPCSLFKPDGGPSHDSSSRNLEEYYSPGPDLWNCQ